MEQDSHIDWIGKMKSKTFGNDEITLVVIITITTAIISLIFGNIFLFVITLFAGLILIRFGIVEPETLKFSLTKDGFYVKEDLSVGIEDLEEYNINDDILILKLKKGIFHSIYFPIQVDVKNKIDEFLKNSKINKNESLNISLLDKVTSYF